MPVNNTPVSGDIDPALDPTLDHLSRRTLLTRAGAGAVAAVAAAPVLAQDADKADKKPRALDDDTLTKTSITAKDGDKQVLEGFLAEPKTTTKRGSILVVHEIFGVTDHIKDVACRYAQAGYTAYAINLFRREGEPPPMSAGFQPLMEFVGKIPDTQIMSDLDKASDMLRKHPHSNGKVGIVGFCWGGRISMLYDAHAPKLNAAIAYYGRISGQPTANQPTYPIDVVAKMHAPLLGNFGAEDTGIPPAEANKLRDALKAANKPAEIYVYENAGHAFNNDTRESYRPEAAKLAMQRSLEWFSKYLK
jgi:carboxymethylenebutenolidase